MLCWGSAHQVFKNAGASLRKIADIDPALKTDIFKDILFQVISLRFKNSSFVYFLT